MFGKWLLSLLLPATLAVGLGACKSSGTMQPGAGYTSASGSYSGDSGRVVSICEVPLRGGNSGASTGTFVGGGLGAAGGAAIGAATTNSVVGAVVGGLLGAVGGAIAGTAIDSGGGRPDAASRSPCRRPTARRSPSRSLTMATCRWAIASPSSPIATASPGPCAIPADIAATPSDMPLKK